MRVTVWNENIQEVSEPGIAAIYPTGIHGAIADGIRPLLPVGTTVRTATLGEPEHGLSTAVIESTDVLLWWGHVAHDRVADAVVERVVNAVLSGMGLIALHSAHFSKVFTRLMGTSCSLHWRDDGDRESVWSVAPGHPIAEGLELPIVLEHHETYGEPFDVPRPDELVFLSGFEGGEAFRSGMTFHRGHGKVFYFSPGDQKYPIYRSPQILRVLSNAILWAKPPGTRQFPQAVHTGAVPRSGPRTAN